MAKKKEITKEDYVKMVVEEGKKLGFGKEAISDFKKLAREFYDAGYRDTEEFPFV
jgi:hypothetical protein